MRAALYESFGGPLEIREVPDPRPAPDEVVVQVLAVGLCRSDFHGWRGADPDIVCPHVGGHEFVGRVVEVGREVRRVGVDQRIVAPFVCGCGQCEPCRAGQHQVCRHQQQPGFTRWGAFADYTTIPYADVNAVSVPDEVSDEAAALVGCRVSTAYRGVVERARLASGEVLAVHGCGGVGLAAVALGRAAGALVVAIDISQEALAMAAAAGASMLIDASAVGNVAGAVFDLAGGAHVSVECLGSEVTTDNSIRCLRPLGRHVQIGLFPSATAALAISRVIRDEIEVLGVHGLSGSRMGAVLDLVRAGSVDPTMMIRQRVGLDDIPRALPAMAAFAVPGVTVAVLR